MSYSLAAHHLDPTCSGLPSDYDFSVPSGGCVPATCVPQGDGIEYIVKSCVSNPDAALAQAKATWSTTTIISVINYSDSLCTAFSYYSFLACRGCNSYNDDYNHQRDYHLGLQNELHSGGFSCIDCDIHSRFVVWSPHGGHYWRCLRCRCLADFDWRQCVDRSP
ncbi:hypothetical protein BC830DRAFT_1126936 [Chytriomyces sp. MP71]|nr:hypothetical protein BC830DRAFT_1126936 [Chytriomyces sp. MP71]